MATTTAEVRAAARPKREREQEVLVWPDLVFIEFISAVLITLGLIVLSSFVNAPLLDRANINVTPNPSKAPWYFMNLQELLLHMHPALAGVIVPTFALVLLAAMPYIDRSNEGQGTYFGTLNSVRITLFSAAYTAFFAVTLVLFDQGRHVNVYENVVGKPWLGDKDLPDWLPGAFEALWRLMFSRNTRAIQTEWQWHVGRLDWPQDFQRIPVPLNNIDLPDWIPDWLQTLYWHNLNINLPAFVVEQFIPLLAMIGLPVLLILILRRLHWVNNTRDVMVAFFSGFVTTFWVLTIIGAAFRGAGQDLVLPWDVPRPEGTAPGH